MVSSASVLEIEEENPLKWKPLDRLRYLLDHWSDIFDPNVASSLNGSRGGSGLDPRLPLMAKNPSVDRLAKALRILKHLHPAEHDHLKAYRCNADWRQVRKTIRFRGPNGKMLEGRDWAKERVVPAWVDPETVQRAEKRLIYWLQDDISIPKELWDGLTKA